MKFQCTRCELCGRHEFSIENIVAYRVRPDGLEIVELHGEQPWVGIRCLCKSCFQWIRNAPGMT